MRLAAFLLAALLAVPLLGTGTSTETSTGTKDPGEECKVGCTAPDLEEITDGKIRDLLEQASRLPFSGSNLALETLLFHHTRVREYLRLHGSEGIKTTFIHSLGRELSRSHVRLSFRVIDEKGVERVRLDPTRVPLGVKQHLLPHGADAIQPPEISGTVMRVGLDHLWTRI